MKDLEPNFDYLSRPVVFGITLALVLYTIVENKVSGANIYWLSGAPLIASLFIVAVYWHLRKKIWFWAIVVAVTSIQEILAFFLPIPPMDPISPILFLAVALDLLLLVVCIKYIGKRV